VTRPTRVLPVADPAALDEAARVLHAGGLVAFPTETVYGLGADATNPDAVARIFEAKGRPANNPLIVHGHEIEQVQRAVSAWPHAVAVLAQRFWPGPLTLVLPRSPIVPDTVTAGLGTVGIRIPDCEVARALLRRFGGPVAAPSANRSNGVSPTTAGHVLADLDGRIDLILDGGPSCIGIESTVLDVTVDPPRVLRPGAITAGQLGRVLGVEVAAPPSPPAGSHAPRTSPGQMDLHYAPRATMSIARPDDVASTPRRNLRKTGLIVAGQPIGPASGVYHEQMTWTDPVLAARELYATLRRWDDEGVERIEVVLPPDEDEWRAVRDRLWRASRKWSQEGRDR
jgi:L-threonylcarbamoyladenylate synthase